MSFAPIRLAPAPLNASSDRVQVAEFRKSPREVVTGSLTRGGRFVDIRVRVPKGAGGVLLQKGLTLSVEQLPDLRQLVESLESAARLQAHAMSCDALPPAA